MPRIRTTHTGSLPRPAELRDLLVAREQGSGVPSLPAAVAAAVDDAVERQVQIGLDLVNDGEMGKVGFAMYVKDRLTGFHGQSQWVGSRRPEIEEHPDFAERWAASLNTQILTTPACNSEIRMPSLVEVHLDIENLLGAAAHFNIPPERLFMTSPSPGVISHFFENHHYPSRRAYLYALADAMRDEYQEIVAAGLQLQVDCPDLAMSRNSVFSDLSLHDFRKEVALNIEALNHALAGIPAERTRMHVCWGNYEGPHTHDIELRDIIDLVLTAKPAGIALEASNPRHAHEWKVFEDVKLPEGRYLIPGVVDTTNNYVEHPDLVAQRLLNYAEVVGPGALMAGTDCGFGTVATMAMVAPSIAWAKLESVVEGAKRASAALAS